MWRTPLIPALRKQRQEDLCEFKASLIYTVRAPGQPETLSEKRQRGEEGERRKREEEGEEKEGGREGGRY